MDKKNAKKKNDLKKDKSSKINDSKKRYRLNVLVVLLTLILIVWVGLLIFKNNQYNKVNDRISKISEYEDKIKYLNNNYGLIEENVKKINDVKNKNDVVNNEINKITKDIEDLHYKISKYGK